MTQTPNSLANVPGEANESAVKGSTDRCSTDTIPCRLCEAPAQAAFKLRLIKRHAVLFYRCTGCGSLQSEEPYWLAEAYASSNLARIDTGAVQRNLNNLAAVYCWAGLTGTRAIFDFGGGDGLLCRLLRDYGLNAQLTDRYATSGYAQDLAIQSPQPPILHTGFEVFEHFAHPGTDLESFFAEHPESALVSTALYEGQASDWWYLTPSSGQHVFFYSKDAMRMIGKRFGYSVHFIGNYTLFDTRRRAFLTKMAARLLLGNVGLRVVRALLMLLPARGAARDFECLTERD